MENTEVISLEQKIGPEAAKAQVQLMLDYYEIDFDDIESKKIRNAQKTSAKKMQKAIEKCRVEVRLSGDDLLIDQKLKHPFDRANGGRFEATTFKTLSGQAKIRLKDRDENDNYGQVYALMGGLCGEPDSTMQSFKGVDLATLEAIASIFLAV
jgi:hypothetical protein